MTDIDVQPDAAAIARHVGDWLVAQANVAETRFALCLSGGSTPRLLYEYLATDDVSRWFPWHYTHIFFGDERFVPPDHPDSNYRMAREALLDHVPLPPGHVHPFPTTGTPAEAAAVYARTLQTFYGADLLSPDRPLFDVTLLGLGEDGHTASLFPGTPVLAERTAWTAAVLGAKPEPRLTLTYPALDSSRTVAFIAAGAGKRDILARVQKGDPALPACHVKPVGTLRWFIDQAVAA